MSIQDVSGNLIINDHSFVAGPIGVGQGTGGVLLADVDLAWADLKVTAQQGDVTIKSTTLHGVYVETLSSGEISLIDMITWRSMGLQENTASVLLSNSTFGGDTRIEGNGDVSIVGSSFSDDGLSVTLNGAVVVTDSRSLSGYISENSGLVQINNSYFSELEVGSNTGGVSIASSTGYTLTCYENSPMPIGSWNNITWLDGQCGDL